MTSQTQTHPQPLAPSDTGPDILLDTQSKSRSEDSLPRIDKEQGAIFGACFIVAMLAALMSYVMLVYRAVPHQDLPSSYEWFLLKTVPGERVIVESGSNARHGLDATKMSDALGRTVINIADNGGYDLEDKIARLDAHARAGDVVLLPLEWSYYYRESVTDNYFESLFTHQSDYFHSLSWPGKVKRALSLPPQMLVQTYKNKQSNAPTDQVTTRPKPNPINPLYINAERFPHGGYSRDESAGLGLGVAGKSCDAYVFEAAEREGGLDISDRFLRALDRLKRLRARGVDIYFLWPSLTGDACLMSDPRYMVFKSDVEAAVNAAGFAYIDTVSQSIFPKAYQDDTPYHLIDAGREIFTTRMIDALLRAGVDVGSGAHDLARFARRRLYDHELEVTQSTPHLRALPLNTRMPIDDIETLDYLGFDTGWWDFEAYGRWMRGHRATLSLKLDEGLSRAAQLELTAQTSEPGPLGLAVYYNGLEIYKGPFENGQVLSLPTSRLPRGEVVRLSFEIDAAFEPRSPLGRGINTDPRTMSFQLQALDLQSDAAPGSPVKDVQGETETRASTDAEADAKSETEISETMSDGEPDKQDSTAYTVDYPSPNAQPSTRGAMSFGQGWWPIERDGIWMGETEAVIEVAAPQSGETSDGMTMIAYVFEPQDAIAKIRVGDSVVIEQPLNVSEFEVYVPFDPNTSEGQTATRINITVEGYEDSSPQMSQAGSGDKRNLILFLRADEARG